MTTSSTDTKHGTYTFEEAKEALEAFDSASHAYNHYCTMYGGAHTRPNDKKRQELYLKAFDASEKLVFMLTGGRKLKEDTP